MTMDAMKPAAGTVVRLQDLPSNPVELRQKLLTSPTSTLAIQRRLVQELTAAGLNLLTDTAEKSAFFNPTTPADQRVDLLLPHIQLWQQKQGMPIGAAAPATYVAPVAAAPVAQAAPTSAPDAVAMAAETPAAIVAPVATPTPKARKSPAPAVTVGSPAGSPEAAAMLAQIAKQLEALPTAAQINEVLQNQKALDTKLDTVLAFAAEFERLKTTASLSAGMLSILVQGGNIYADSLADVIVQSVQASNALHDEADKQLAGKD